MYHEDNGDYDEHSDVNAMSVDYNNNCHEFDDYETISTVDSTVKQQQKIIDAYKQSDPNYHKVKFIDEKRKSYFVELYTTPNVIGAPIRNAVTGIRHSNYLVGSRQEHLYFKIKLATGQIGRDSATMFFDTPEQCERHMRQGNIDPRVKEKWLKKYIEVESELY
jgi:hypothetical protein